MVNTVLNSISKALHTTFGDSYYYYVEDIEQKAKLPCFTIGTLNPLNRSTNRKDYYRTMPCVIHYFSADKNNTIKNSYAVGEQVLDCLEYLSVDGRLIRGEDMSYTMTNNVLQVFITYRFWTEKPETLTNMEDLTTVEPSITST